MVSGVVSACFSAARIEQETNFIHRLQALVPVDATGHLHHPWLRLKLRPNLVERRLGRVEITLKDGTVHQRDRSSATGRKALGGIAGLDQAAILPNLNWFHSWPIPEGHEVCVGFCGSFALDKDIAVDPVAIHCIALLPELA